MYCGMTSAISRRTRDHLFDGTSVEHAFILSLVEGDIGAVNYEKAFGGFFRVSGDGESMNGATRFVEVTPGLPSGCPRNALIVPFVFGREEVSVPSMETLIMNSRRTYCRRSA